MGIRRDPIEAGGGQFRASIIQGVDGHRRSSWRKSYPVTGDGDMGGRVAGREALGALLVDIGLALLH